MEGRIALPESLMRWAGALLVLAMLCASLAACGGAGKTKGPSSASSGLAGSTGAATSTTSTERGEADAESHPSSANAGATSGSSVLGVPNGDQDGDSSNDTAFDKDDSFVTTFGHAAGPGDRKAITDLVTRYYAAIAKEDGATACRLLFFTITESAPETYGQTSFDAAAGRGQRCGPVMSKVFKGSHAQLVAENRHLKVMAIRIQGKRAWVLLRFGPNSVRRTVAYREGSSWKIGELLDTELV